jgi:hypothetical protein
MVPSHTSSQQKAPKSLKPHSQIGCYTLLDTIAQPVHQPKKHNHRGDLATLKQKAKNHFFSKKLAQALTQLPNSPLNKAYKRTFFDCGALLLQEGQKLTSRYCNGRWCNTCNRIRTAKLTEGYKKPLADFKQPYFVTLTIPNVGGEVLKDEVKNMLRNFQLITRSIRRKVEFNGIRKLECTYNDNLKNYHPHFHVLVDGRDNSETLVREWLNRNPKAESWCQDIRSADTGSLLELFKYTTKIVSKSKKDGFKIYVGALDTIFQSLYGLRTFQPFGNVKMVSEDVDELKAETYDIPYYESVVWMWQENDWFSMLHGDALTGYEPSKKMIELTTEKMQR